MKKSEDTEQDTYTPAEQNPEIAELGGGAEQLQGEDFVGDSLENLPVQLEVHLAEIGLTLSKFRTLTAGMTVPLNIDLSAKLDITVNGIKFGHGTLVQIGQKIGIQIEKWQTEQEH